MVTFNYTAKRPDNYEQLEENIKEMYKDIFDKFPNSETVFTWTGEKWSIGTNIELALFTHHVNDSDNT